MRSYKVADSAVWVFEIEVRELADDPESFGLDEEEAAMYRLLDKAYESESGRLFIDPADANDLGYALTELANAQDAVAELHRDADERRDAGRARDALTTLALKAWRVAGDNR
jgi:hypothetical protein